MNASDTSGDPPGEPDLTGFDRVNVTAGMGSGLTSIVSLSTDYLGQIGPMTHPRQIPWRIIDLMDFDPPMSVAEHLWASLLRNEDLYRVEHSDPAIRAEAEAWLAPIKARLLEVICIAFSYGVVPYVLDWKAEPLSFEVKRDGKAPFTSTKPMHQHYVDVHDLHPRDVTLWTKGDRITKLEYGDKDFLPGRAFVSVWGRKWGDWLGNGSRRKAYKAWFRSEHTEVWRGRFLERNVDPPRKGHAPAGTVKIDGEDVQTADLMADVFMGLKGGGMATLPGGLEPGSTTLRAWDVEAMDLNAKAGSDVFNTAQSLAAIEKFMASLVPPSAAGVQDAAFASGRVHAEMLEDVLNVASNWVARQLDAPLAAVHAVGEHSSKPAPRARAREFPKAKMKRLLEVMKVAADAQHELKAESDDAAALVYSLADLVDPVNLLEELGIKTLSIEEAAHEKQAPPPGPVGRPRDAMGDRDDRRKNAREPEGEDATGADGEQVDDV